MRAFQIWDRPTPPPEPYLGFMRNVLALSDAYTLVSPVDFLGAHHEPFQPWMDALPEHLRAKPNGLRIYDALRAMYLSQHFDHAYFDVDVELFEAIPIKDAPQKNGPGLLVGNGDPALGLCCWQTYLRIAKFVCRPATLMFRHTPTESIDPSLFHHHYAHGRY